MRSRAIVVLLCAGLFSILGPPSLADGTSFDDAKDAYGPLDVKSMTHGHGVDRGDLVHSMETYRRWNRNKLRSKDSEIQFLFNKDRDARPERVLVIDVEGSRLVAEMRRWNRSGDGKVYGTAAVSRPNAKELRVVFERSLLGERDGEYGWHIDTRFHRPNHVRCNVTDGTIVVCPDSAPNRPRSYLVHGG